MHVQDALERLDQIHHALARCEVYRGFRVPTIALVGAIGLLAAAVQPHLPEAARGVGFAYYWVAVAAIGGLLGTAAALRAYLFREDDFARRRTQRVIFQFLPSVMVGGALTAAVLRSEPALVPFLPGIWAMLFGLGVVAASPYLPSAVGLVGIAYLFAGMLLLAFTRAAAEPSSWGVGGVFGAGHFATALALWKEENDDA